MTFTEKCTRKSNRSASLQVGPEVDERELIQAFERHGTVVSYKLLRGSMCGFIDFERIEEAASARSALHEAKFADCEIRVEYKVLSLPLYTKRRTAFGISTSSIEQSCKAWYLASIKAIKM